MLIQQIEEIYTSLKSETNLSRYKVSLLELEESLQCVDFNVVISYIPSNVESLINKMSPADSESLKKLLILSSALTSWSGIFNGSYPKSVIKQYEKTLSRIIKVCESEKGWGNGNIDVYWKDLAIVRRIMFPAGLK